VLSEFEQLPSMSEESTGTPKNTDSPKTRRVLDLLFSNRKQGRHTLFPIQMTADLLHITSRICFATKRYELPYFLQRASQSTRTTWINRDGAWFIKLLLTQ